MKLTSSTTTNHFGRFIHCTIIVQMDLSHFAYFQYWLKRCFILTIIFYGNLGSSN
jgi:hypothetical protein